jgi:hypothetical protein
MTVPQSGHEWFVLAERSVLRVVMIVTGLILMIVGLALGVSMVMLPAGVVLGLTGVGVFVWGAVGELPVGQ